MKRARFLTVALAGFGLLLGASQAQAAGKHAKNTSDWKLLGAAGDAMPGVKYNLRNITENESVRYGKRKWGINLVWDKATTLNVVRFDRKGGAGPLMYGDVVAIHVENGGYLHYQKRDVGVNLVWSTPPMYEFVILGGKKGTPVKMESAFGLYNQVEKDFMIYGERPAGINLRWWKDRELSGGVRDRLEGGARKAVSEGVRKIADRVLGK